MTSRMTWLWLLVPLLSGGCATVPEDQSGDNKVLVSRGAYQLLQKNDQATAVFKEKADEVESELVCERILYGGYRNLRTICYARKELDDRKRQHHDTFQELTLFPGSGG